MSKRTLGSLADLAKIMEEASDPESVLREDRKESKPKVIAAKKMTAQVRRAIDPKRKAWYDKRLREQAAPKAPESVQAVVAAGSEFLLDPSQTKAVAARTTAGLLQVLATANKPKAESKQRAEAWRRKPGDPIF